MSILMAEYDYATDIAVQKEEAYEDGLFAGLERGLVTGREEGISIGMERGAYQTKLETARKLIGRGYDPEDIVDLSGLTLSQVQELLKS